MDRWTIQELWPPGKNQLKSVASVHLPHKHVDLSLDFQNPLKNLGTGVCLCIPGPLGEMGGGDKGT